MLEDLCLRTASSPSGRDVDGKTLSPDNSDVLPRLGFALGWATRDSWTNPRRGWQNELELWRTGGDARFWTMTLDVRRWFPTARRQRLLLSSLLSLQSGTVGEDIPTYLIYRMGGANSIRGYKISDLGRTRLRGDVLEPPVPLKSSPARGIVAFVQTNVLADAPVANRLLEQLGARLLAGVPYPAVPDVVPVEPAALAAVAGDYALDSGGRLRLEPRDGVLVASPLDPAAFRVLLSTDPLDPARAARLAQQVDALVGSCRKGDFGPLAAAYGGRVTTDHLRAHWNEEMERLGKDGGALRGHHVLGTARQGDRDVTVVRLELKRGEADWAYVFTTDAREALRGRSVRGLEPRLSFEPTGAGSFGSWDGGLTPSKPLVFERTSRGERRLRLGEGPMAATGRLVAP